MAVASDLLDIEERDAEFVAILQAQAASLISVDEARRAVKGLFPHWFEEAQ